jgi:nucleoside-diphosphate-sugar epimerase
LERRLHKGPKDRTRLRLELRAPQIEQLYIPVSDYRPKNIEMPRILVTGGGGYIGSVLVKDLLDAGYTVTCMDRFFFGYDPLAEVMGNPNLTVIKEDIRWFDSNILKNIDIAMDLAAISNDPSGELDPSKTYDINFLGRSRVARLCKHYGVKQYILASSTSLYGYQDGLVDETSKTNPLTSYARANRNAEEDVVPISSEKFSVTVLRFATVYGPSKRMRFDLAVNSMVLGLYRNARIPVNRDGMQWRPFIHISDVVRAYKLMISSSKEKINGQIYNVGSNEQNYQILPLADLVGKSLGIDYEIDWYGSPDFRSYKVSFDRIHKDLSFKAKYTVAEGAKDIFQKLKGGDLCDTLKTRTVSWYKYLLECHNVSQEIALRNSVL